MIYNKLIVPFTCILSSREAYTCILLKESISYPKNISTVKKGEDKKVQVTEWPKDVISLWGQEEKLYPLGCVYRTPTYKINSFKSLYISCKLSKDNIFLANS